MTGLVYDTGALIAADRNDRRMWSLHARALARGVRAVVPAAVLVEAWRGDQPSLSRLLVGCAVDSPTVDDARRAGALLRHVAAGPVDAMVVEVAVRERAAVVTSDRSDILQLAAAAHRRLDVVDI